MSHRSKFLASSAARAASGASSTHSSAASYVSRRVLRRTYASGARAGSGIVAPSLALQAPQQSGQTPGSRPTAESKSGFATRSPPSIVEYGRHSVPADMDVSPHTPSTQQQSQTQSQHQSQPPSNQQQQRAAGRGSDVGPGKARGEDGRIYEQIAPPIPGSIVGGFYAREDGSRSGHSDTTTSHISAGAGTGARAGAGAGAGSGDWAHHSVHTRKSSADASSANVSASTHSNEKPPISHVAARSEERVSTVADHILESVSSDANAQARLGNPRAAGGEGAQAARLRWSREDTLRDSQQQQGGQRQQQGQDHAWSRSETSQARTTSTSPSHTTTGTSTRVDGTARANTSESTSRRGSGYTSEGGHSAMYSQPWRFPLYESTEAAEEARRHGSRGDPVWRSKAGRDDEAGGATRGTHESSTSTRTTTDSTSNGANAETHESIQAQLQEALRASDKAAHTHIPSTPQNGVPIGNIRWDSTTSTRASDRGQDRGQDHGQSASDRGQEALTAREREAHESGVLGAWAETEDTNADHNANRARTHNEQRYGAQQNRSNTYGSSENREHEELTSHAGVYTQPTTHNRRTAQRNERSSDTRQQQPLRAHGEGVQGRMRAARANTDASTRASQARTSTHNTSSSATGAHSATLWGRNRPESAQAAPAAPPVAHATANETVQAQRRVLAGVPAVEPATTSPDADAEAGGSTVHASAAQGRTTGTRSGFKAEDWGAYYEENDAYAEDAAAEDAAWARDENWRQQRAGGLGSASTHTQTQTQRDTGSKGSGSEQWQGWGSERSSATKSATQPARGHSAYAASEFALDMDGFAEPEPDAGYLNYDPYADARRRAAERDQSQAASGRSRYDFEEEFDAEDVAMMDGEAWVGRTEADRIRRDMGEAIDEEEDNAYYTDMVARAPTFAQARAAADLDAHPDITPREYSILATTADWREARARENRRAQQSLGATGAGKQSSLEYARGLGKGKEQAAWGTRTWEANAAVRDADKAEAVAGERARHTAVAAEQEEDEHVWGAGEREMLSEYNRKQRSTGGMPQWMGIATTGAAASTGTSSATSTETPRKPDSSYATESHASAPPATSRTTHARAGGTQHKSGEAGWGMRGTWGGATHAAATGTTATAAVAASPGTAAQGTSTSTRTRTGELPSTAAAHTRDHSLPSSSEHGMHLRHNQQQQHQGEGVRELSPDTRARLLRSKGADTSESTIARGLGDEEDEPSDHDFFNHARARTGPRVRPAGRQASAAGSMMHRDHEREREHESEREMGMRERQRERDNARRREGVRTPSPQPRASAASAGKTSAESNKTSETSTYSWQQQQQQQQSKGASASKGEESGIAKTVHTPASQAAAARTTRDAAAAARERTQEQVASLDPSHISKPAHETNTARASAEALAGSERADSRAGRLANTAAATAGRMGVDASSLRFTQEQGGYDNNDNTSFSRATNARMDPGARSRETAPRPRVYFDPAEEDIMGEFDEARAEGGHTALAQVGHTDRAQASWRRGEMIEAELEAARKGGSGGNIWNTPSHGQDTSAERTSSSERVGRGAGVSSAFAELIEEERTEHMHPQAWQLRDIDETDYEKTWGLSKDQYQEAAHPGQHTAHSRQAQHVEQRPQGMQQTRTSGGTSTSTGTGIPPRTPQQQQQQQQQQHSASTSSHSQEQQQRRYPFQQQPSSSQWSSSKGDVSDARSFERANEATMAAYENTPLASTHTSGSTTGAGVKGGMGENTWVAGAFPYPTIGDAEHDRDQGGRGQQQERKQEEHKKAWSPFKQASAGGVWLNKAPAHEDTTTMNRSSTSTTSRHEPPKSESLATQHQQRSQTQTQTQQQQQRQQHQQHQQQHQHQPQQQGQWGSEVTRTQHEWAAQPSARGSHGEEAGANKELHAHAWSNHQKDIDEHGVQWARWGQQQQVEQEMKVLQDDHTLTHPPQTNGMGSSDRRAEGRQPPPQDQFALDWQGRTAKQAQTAAHMRSDRGQSDRGQSDRGRSDRGQDDRELARALHEDTAADTHDARLEASLTDRERRKHDQRDMKSNWQPNEWAAPDQSRDRDRSVSSSSTMRSQERTRDPKDDLSPPYESWFGFVRPRPDADADSSSHSTEAGGLSRRPRGSRRAGAADFPSRADTEAEELRAERREREKQRARGGAERLRARAKGADGEIEAGEVGIPIIDQWMQKLTSALGAGMGSSSNRSAGEGRSRGRAAVGAAAAAAAGTMRSRDMDRNTSSSSVSSSRDRDMDMRSHDVRGPAMSRDSHHRDMSHRDSEQQQRGSAWNDSPRDPLSTAPAAADAEAEEADDADDWSVPPRDDNLATPAEARALLKEMRSTPGFVGSVLRAFERAAGALERDIERNLGEGEQFRDRAFGTRPEQAHFERLNPWASAQLRARRQELGLEEAPQASSTAGAGERGLERPSAEHYGMYKEDKWLRQYPQDRDAVSGTWMPFPKGLEASPSHAVKQSATKEADRWSTRASSSSSSSGNRLGAGMAAGAGAGAAAGAAREPAWNRRDELDSTPSTGSAGRGLSDASLEALEGVPKDVAARLRAMFDEETLQALLTVGADEQDELLKRVPRRSGTWGGNEERKREEKKGEYKWDDGADLP